MELLFVTVIGAGIGLILRYLLPQRESYGLLLLPSVAAATTAAVWVALVWLGFTFDGTWIWVASLLAAVLSAIATALLVSRHRKTVDATLFAQLSSSATP